MPPRARIQSDAELRVLDKSRRRCALCFQINGDLDEKLGQLAHLNGDRADSRDRNLVFLCLDHHSVFDSKTSQHKNYTSPEVKSARDRLYAAIEQNEHLKHSPVVCPGPISQGSGNALSFNQSGGITAGTYVNQAPEPELKLLKAERAKTGDSFTNTVLIQVASPYPPARIRLEVKARSLLGGLEISPQRAGPLFFGHSGVRDGLAFATLLQPQGTFVLTVRTREPEAVDLTYTFD